MNKWTKIKERIFSEKLSEIDSLLVEVQQSITNTPRHQWTDPINSWSAKQIKNNSLKLSLEEYSKLKAVTEELQTTFLSSVNNEQQLTHYGQTFKNLYSEFIQEKEEDLKLEIAAELIEENKLPLQNLVDWYLMHQDLPEQQFSEALGEFWGDVWNKAKSSALHGALTGGVAGTFAGTGLAGTVPGMVAGGLLGGAYGGGKHLLQKIWNYRKGQVAFEQSKQEAFKALKNLKKQAKNFEMDANFKNTLDQMIEKLGTAKAYQVVQPPSQHPEEPPYKLQEPASYDPVQYVHAGLPRFQQISGVKPEEQLPKQEPKQEETPKKEEPQEPLPKLGDFKSLHDIMRYYEANHKEIPVLGHLMRARGWENPNIDDIPFEKIKKALTGKEHLHTPESIQELESSADFEHDKEIGHHFIDQLKSRFHMTHPVGNRSIEHKIIVDKYLKLLREQAS